MPGTVDIERRRGWNVPERVSVVETKVQEIQKDVKELKEDHKQFREENANRHLEVSKELMSMKLESSLNHQHLDKKISKFQWVLIGATGVISIIIMLAKFM